jgi:putative membrane protein
MHLPLFAFVRPALAGALALALALPAGAQTGGSGSSGASAPSSPSQRSAARATSEDHEMLEDLAHAHLAEIEASRIALDKTRNASVRSFAQQMIDEHGQALQELQQLGQKKQLSVPTETDFQHKAIAAALRLLSGDTFDRQYIRQVGVNDHRRSVDLLMKMQQSARDPELQAHAGKLLPGVQRHLAQAREMQQKMK